MEPGRMIPQWIRIFLVTAAVAGAGPARSASADFYKGKSVTVLIGVSAGGGYDLYARLLSRFITAHMTGAPAFVPQNMPGAGSLNAIAYLANAAPRDGTVIATFSRGMPLYPLLFKHVFDGSRLGYIGSMATDTSLCIVSKTSKIRDWKDLLIQPSVFGGQGKGADPDLFTSLIDKLYGAKIKLVTGYPGNADILLAMQRGEVDGMCGLSYSTLASTHGDWLRSGAVRVLVQAAIDKNPALPDTPSLLDLAPDENVRKVVELVVAPQALARPFATPPGVPPERLQALRAAFDATMKDPAFLAAAKKAKADIDPLSGTRIQSLIQRLYTTPKAILSEAADAIGGS
jgi:tripartite-type tricarboxylate transporter receptor subunit TctC